jgi:hypothetical protein
MSVLSLRNLVSVKLAVLYIQYIQSSGLLHFELDLRNLPPKLQEGLELKHYVNEVPLNEGHASKRCGYVA